jgi:hypothetical protein
VSDSNSNAATQINAATGQILQTISDSSYGFGDPSVAFEAAGSVYIATPYGSSPMVTRMTASNGAFHWYMCNTNDHYYFSSLSAFAVSGNNLWVASRTGANYPSVAAGTGSLTEMSAITGLLIRTIA